MVDAGTIETVTGSVGNARSAVQMVAGAEYLRFSSLQCIDDPGTHIRQPIHAESKVAIDVGARQLGENSPDFEVTLTLRCQGFQEMPVDGAEAKPLFEAIVTWAGLFALQNSTAEIFETLLLVDAPRLLFPAARNYLANMTRDAGYKPVIMQQVDFMALWRSRRNAAKS
ncbi:MAG: protein-export chaperone SecB [Acetobacter sp.]|jgi:preprotein translocase subunit SecB|nr:protein-export chaperone SecB [Acetobacter sp.]MCH4062436.1 protein-export chaperone SecB [Acetobacter sp.]MCH4088717.1 protein-export chaperone SecB [Acetobacter sp.]MCI1292622.1 protein-export chaperone SecB [Acetobacter sp.]MCI1319278.1 protein-export chaperone SecB [Acetobacter sp.]